MRYQIWDKQTDIFTPAGHKFTAAEWAARYPWVNQPGAKMVITTGIINGGTAMEFNATKDIYIKRGAKITDGMTDEEVLAAIEDFEDNPPGADMPSTEERIAASLEAQVMMATPDADVQATPMMARAMSLSADDADALSVAAKRIQRSYQAGLWSAALVAMAVQKGIITAAEQQAILQG